MPKKTADPESLPYRPCVGVMLLNARGEVWTGCRADMPGDAEGPGQWWQMPQGGIDPGEDPWPAALRELYEETNVRSVERLAESAGWLTYDLPADLVGVAWKGRYRGQKQKWFALRFTGRDDEIDILQPGGGRFQPEFAEWRWSPADRLVDSIVPFKRAVYEAVVDEFAPLLAAR